MASLIVGMIGRKRAGKDTFAARLTAAHGFTRVALADPLRDAALALDPLIRVDDDSLWGTPFWDQFVARLSDVVDTVGWERAKANPEVRRTLQRLGTEMGRGVLGEDVWVDALARRVEAVPGPVVVTDVRFPNEARWVTDPLRFPRGITVRITRPGLPHDDLHPSEVALDGWPADIVAQNDGDVAALHQKADLVARVLTPRA